MNTKDKRTLLSWIQNTSTSDVHEVFKKLGYVSSEQIYHAIRKGSKK